MVDLKDRRMGIGWVETKARTKDFWSAVQRVFAKAGKLAAMKGTRSVDYSAVTLAALMD